MRNIQPTMNVAKQRRKITHLLDNASSLAEAIYLAWLLGQFDAEVWLGVPRPASEFLGMFEEEFSA